MLWVDEYSRYFHPCSQAAVVKAGEESPPGTEIKLQPQLAVEHYVRLLSNELCCVCSRLAASCHMPSDTSRSGWASTLSSQWNEQRFSIPVSQRSFQLCGPRLPTILQVFPFKQYKSIVGWGAAFVLFLMEEEPDKKSRWNGFSRQSL